jgi:hypothetical protein
MCKTEYWHEGNNNVGYLKLYYILHIYAAFYFKSWNVQEVFTMSKTFPINLTCIYLFSWVLLSLFRHLVVYIYNTLHRCEFWLLMCGEVCCLAQSSHSGLLLWYQKSWNCMWGETSELHDSHSTSNPKVNYFRILPVLRRFIKVSFGSHFV